MINASQITGIQNKEINDRIDTFHWDINGDRIDTFHWDIQINDRLDTFHWDINRDSDRLGHYGSRLLEEVGFCKKEVGNGIVCVQI